MVGRWLKTRAPSRQGRPWEFAILCQALVVQAGNASDTRGAGSYREARETTSVNAIIGAMRIVR